MPAYLTDDTIDTFTRDAYSSISLTELRHELNQYEHEMLAADNDIHRACAREDADLMRALIADREATR